LLGAPAPELATWPSTNMLGGITQILLDWLHKCCCLYIYEPDEPIRERESCMSEKSDSSVHEPWPGLRGWSAVESWERRGVKFVDRTAVTKAEGVA